MNSADSELSRLREENKVLAGRVGAMLTELSKMNYTLRRAYTMLEGCLIVRGPGGLSCKACLQHWEPGVKIKHLPTCVLATVVDIEDEKYFVLAVSVDETGRAYSSTYAPAAGPYTRSKAESETYMLNIVQAPDSLRYIILEWK